MRERTSKLLISASLAMSGAAIALSALTAADLVKEDAEMTVPPKRNTYHFSESQTINSEEFYVLRNESAKPNELPFILYKK